VLLDTNAISAWAENERSFLRVLRNDCLWYLPSIALGEFHYGLVKSLKRDELEPWLAEIEEACVVLSRDITTAILYGELRRDLELVGINVPYHDIWIGALAQQHSVPVASRDAHFDHMPGVTRISW
jgi:predicted nucleic acid-binding protein